MLSHQGVPGAGGDLDQQEYAVAPGQEVQVRQPAPVELGHDGLGGGEHRLVGEALAEGAGAEPVGAFSADVPLAEERVHPPVIEQDANADTLVGQG